jgi:hypothetical protein
MKRKFLSRSRLGSKRNVMKQQNRRKGKDAAAGLLLGA